MSNTPKKLIPLCEEIRLFFVSSCLPKRCGSTEIPTGNNVNASVDRQVSELDYWRENREHVEQMEKLKEAKKMERQRDAQIRKGTYASCVL